MRKSIEHEEKKKALEKELKQVLKVEAVEGEDKRQTTIYLSKSMDRRLMLYRLDKRKFNDMRNQIIMEALDRYLTAEGY